MAYSINFSDPNKPPITVPDGQTIVDTAASITFVGKGKINYGEIIQENLLHMLESFASSSPPANPIEGQVWFDTGTRTINVYKVPGEGAPLYGWREISLTEGVAGTSMNNIKEAAALS